MLRYLCSFWLVFVDVGVGVGILMVKTSSFKTKTYLNEIKWSEEKKGDHKKYGSEHEYHDSKKGEHKKGEKKASGFDEGKKGELFILMILSVCVFVVVCCLAIAVAAFAVCYYFTKLIFSVTNSQQCDFFSFCSSLSPYIYVHILTHLKPKHLVHSPSYKTNLFNIHRVRPFYVKDRALVHINVVLL